MKCKGKTKAGKSCPNNALKGGRYCYTHAPETRAQQAEARKRGGFNRATPHFASLEGLPSDPKTNDEAAQYAMYVWKETAGMENSIQRNRLLLACCEMLFTRKIELGEHEQRIAALEARNTTLK